MGTVTYTELEHGVGRLTLSSGSGNPLTPETVEALNSELGKLTDKPPQALVLDGGDGSIFSGGFALPIIASWDRDQINSFFGGFLHALDRLMNLGCPTVGAINGHAIAGGFIFSLGCDLRVVKTGKIKLGLSEVDLGVCVPAGTQVLLGARTSPQFALRVAMQGHLFGAEEALAAGYADMLADDPLASAIEVATKLAQKPGHGSAVTKTLCNGSLSQRVREADAAGLEAFLDSWFSTAAQQSIQALAAKLAGK